MSSNWKILPPLIIVAILAFSVRLVEVVTGFATMAHSGVALAEEEKPAENAKEEKATEAEKKEEAKTGEINSTQEKAEASKDEKTAAKTPEESKKSVEKKAEDKNETGGQWPDAGDAEMDLSATKMELVQDLVDRRAALDKRENELIAREALLKAAEQELDQKFTELTALRTDIEGLLKQQSDEEKARTTSLVKVYEGMKPKDAARIFDTLDLDILMSVVSNMSPKKLSPILAQMNEERARTVTIMLAEEKKLPTLPLAN